MSQPPLLYYCAHCGKAHAWAPQKAGHTVFCACGKPGRVPSQPQAAPPPTAADADTQPPVDPPQQSIPSADLRGKRTIQYQTQDTTEPTNWREFIRGSELKHLIVPVAFMVLAVIIRFGLVIVGDSSGGGHLLAGFGVAAATMAINTVVLFLGVGIVAKFTGAELGPLPLTIIKLASAGMLGSVILGTAAAFEMRGIGASVVAIPLLALLYWVLFSIFFDMDLQETLMAVALIGFMQAGTMCILWQK